MVHRIVVSFLLLATSLFHTGCGGNPSVVDMGGEDGSKVASLIEELNEVKHSPKKMAEYFSSKPNPSDSKKLNLMTFYVKGKPTINGTTATCNVQVEKQDGTPVGEIQWNFEKLAQAWKIKSAPLP